MVEKQWNSHTGLPPLGAHVLSRHPRKREDPPLGSASLPVPLNSADYFEIRHHKEKVKKLARWSFSKNI